MPGIYEFAIRVALVLLVFGGVTASSSAQDAKAGAGSEPAATEQPCQTRPSFSVEYGDNAASKDAYDYIMKGKNMLARCAQMVKEQADALRSGEDGLDWDKYNQNLKRLIDAYISEIDKIKGKGGALETATILQVVVEAEKKNIERQFADDEKGRKKRLNDMNKKHERLTDASEAIKKYSENVMASLIQAHKYRPKLASDIRRKAINEAIAVFEIIADGLKKDAEAFKKISDDFNQVGNGTGQ